ncbi:MAG: ribonuclease P protein component [Gemmatimonadales bacterium]
MTAGRGTERAGRLARTDEVRQVLERGRRRRLGFIEVAWRRREAGHLRLGLIVPKFQSTAVARNRLRRRLRELARRLASKAGPLDVVIRARRQAYGASFAELRAEMATWLADLGAGG